MTRGNGPVRLLDSKLKYSNDDILLKDDGTVAIRLLLLRSNMRSFGNMPKSLGMLPFNLFPERDKFTSFWQYCMVGGILPSKRLFDKTSSLKRCRRLISCGRKPLKLLLERSSETKKERLAI